MIPPLFVTDEAGNLIYKSGSVSMPTAFRTYLKTADSPRGISEIHGHPIYVKPVRLGGHVYRFFMDFDRLCEVYGVSAADRAADGLFDLSALETAPRQAVSLSALLSLFYQRCPDAARVRLPKIHAPEKVTVEVAPNAFALALSLIVRLLGGTACFSFAVECGRVTVYADGKAGSEPAAPLFDALLREVCGAAGFALTATDRGALRSFALELTPLDPAALGLKAASLPGYEKNFALYAAWFC